MMMGYSKGMPRKACQIAEPFFAMAFRPLATASANGSTTLEPIVFLVVARGRRDRRAD